MDLRHPALAGRSRRRRSSPRSSSGAPSARSETWVQGRGWYATGAIRSTRSRPGVRRRCAGGRSRERGGGTAGGDAAHAGGLRHHEPSPERTAHRLARATSDSARLSAASDSATRTTPASRSRTSSPSPRPRRGFPSSRSSATPTACPTTRLGPRRCRSPARTDRLYGRGACDTKAFIACALLAAERTRRRELKKPLRPHLHRRRGGGLPRGEEAARSAKRGRPRDAIVGEPTSLTPIRANKGYCLAEIEVTGKEGHSAYPDSRRLGHLPRRAPPQPPRGVRQGPAPRRDVDPSFEPPFTTLNVGRHPGRPGEERHPRQLHASPSSGGPFPRQPVERRALGARAAHVRQLRREDPGLDVRMRMPRHGPRRGHARPTAEVVAFLENQSGQRLGDGELRHRGAADDRARRALRWCLARETSRSPTRPVSSSRWRELLRCEEILETAIRHFCG